jgi:predicted NAD-dependent protein-ADP-ribosyltransferase YbiA (DUF1768 family)
MSGEDCRFGKDFNPKTCRYIKGCRNGYSRNTDFKCVKDTSGTLKKRSYAKEQIGLMKELFSNSNMNSNGLFNSPPSRREKTKRLRASTHGKTMNPSRSKGTKLQVKSQTQTLKDMRRFIENIGPRIVNMNSPEVFDLARKEGIELGNFQQKYLFRKCVLAYLSTLQPKSKSKKKSKGSKSKRVQFRELEEPQPSDPLDSPPLLPFSSPPPQSRSKIVRKTKTVIPSEKPKPSKSKESSGLKSKASKPKSLTKNEKEKLIIEFLNKIGIRISELTMRQIKEIARPQGIALDTESYVSQFKELAKEFIDSYENMNMKYALMILNVNPDYTLEQLIHNFKERSLALFPQKSFAEKKETQEFIRLQNAFEFLKERLENNDFQHVSVEMPTEKSIINLNGSELYTPETTFLFYSKSSDVIPGKGSGEKMKEGDQDKYNTLSKIKDWRKKLSNFWISPFNLEGKRWQSVEHYYQGSKFKANPEFYNQFSLDSNSDISKDTTLAKAAGGKTGKFKGKLVRPVSIKIDEDYFPDRSKIEMYKAQHAKFTQNDDLMHLLKLTRDAKLVHYTRGSPPVVFDNLMHIRSKL